MIRKVCKWVVFKIVYPLWYFLFSRRKVEKNFYIFVENHMEKPGDNFELLYRRLEQQGAHVKVHYLKVYEGNYLQIVKRSLSLIQDMAVAQGVFLSESNSLFGAFTLRKETQLVQVWHACGAFKRWGRSVADKTFGEGLEELTTYNGHRNYTLVPVSGEEVCWAYEEAFGLEDSEVVEPLGVSRTDVYFNPEMVKKAENRLREAIPWKGERKILLYAPTFRGDIKNAHMPDALDLDMLYKALHQEYIILIRNHPFVKQKMDIPKEYQKFAMEIKDELTTSQLLMVADCCITDYSSIVFEYSLMEKPMLFFAYDLAEYYDERGFYYPYETFVPGKIVTTTEGIIEGLCVWSDKDRERIVDFKARYMSGCDGRATQRILQRMNQIAAKQEEKNDGK